LKKYTTIFIGLLSKASIKIALWTLSFLIVSLNLFVIVYRRKSKKWKATKNVFLLNLAFSDTVMGFYLLGFGLADTFLSGIYVQKEFTWRKSIACKMLGFMSVLAIEVPLITLTGLSSIQMYIFRYTKRPGIFTFTKRSVYMDFLSSSIWSTTD